MKALSLSIRRQLLAWLLIPLSALWVTFGVVAYYLSIGLTTYAYDRALAESALYVVSHLRLQGSTVRLDLPKGAEAMLRDDPKDLIYFQVLGPDGRLIAGDAALPALDDRDMDTSPSFRYGTVAGRHVRIGTVDWPLPDASGRYVRVQVAETIKERQALERRILLTIAVPEVLTILLSGVVVALAVGRGLAPLKAVQKAVESRSPADLSPLQEHNAPKEVRPLVRAVNGLLNRLEQDIEAQRRFVSNAAHQLRTPLAGLKTQTQVALRQSSLEDIRRALDQTHKSAERCARLVHQLLVLARVEPGSLLQANYAIVDLGTLARNATEELVPEALARGIDLGLEGASEPALVRGDALTLHELIFNLVENAVRYTQRGGKVTVRLATSGGTNLFVEDNGPGIPVKERARVFERFYRVLGSGASGSGLGLAIVAEIAEAHGARVALTDGPGGCGTKAVVCFPPVAPEPAAHLRAVQENSQ